jgi:adenylate cyclase
VLFLEVEPTQAIDIALDIIAVVGRDERLPDVRIGLATGPVVMRMGDVYGPPVNLAARLTGVARRNRVIIDERTAEMLPVADFETRKLPARPLRGFGDVEPVTVRRTRPRH